jgi:hypothetical protein
MTKKELLGHLYDVFKSVSDFADGILQIEYVNVFDLIVDTAKKDVNALEKTQRLKCMLAHLDNILPKPDVVLIEYQMVQNDTSRSISNQIMYHYCDHVDFKMGHKSGDIGYALKGYPLKPVTLEKTNTIVNLVGPSLKNEYGFCEEGQYHNFISKYTNYIANKKHTTFNFRWFLDKNNLSSEFKKMKDTELYDMADAFMMIYGWLKKNKML